MAIEKCKLTDTDKFHISETVKILESMSSSRDIGFVYFYAKAMKDIEDSQRKKIAKEFSDDEILKTANTINE